MQPLIVPVETTKRYDVHIGNGLLQSSGQVLREMNCRQAVIFSDSHVAPLYCETVEKALKDRGISAQRYVFPAGESSKSMTELSKALEFLAEKQLPRDGVILSLGGGVVGDMAGFAASVYLRGVRFLQMPTTLLAAVDSSVGGKAAVNLAAGKNLAGAFIQPEIVLCDTSTLCSLPQEQWKNGIAEAIKYGVLFDSTILSIISRFADSENVSEIISRCVQWKAKIVSQDEFDRGDRRLLNLGHTIGHAIEKCSHFAISHGQSVAIGMVWIARAGEAMGISQSGTAKRIEKILQKQNLPVECDYSDEELSQAILQDKKRAGGEIVWIFPERIGLCRMIPFPTEKTKDILALGRKENP